MQAKFHHGGTEITEFCGISTRKTKILARCLENMPPTHKGKPKGGKERRPL